MRLYVMKDVIAAPIYEREEFSEFNVALERYRRNFRDARGIESVVNEIITLVDGIQDAMGYVDIGGRSVNKTRVVDIGMKLAGRLNRLYTLTETLEKKSGECMEIAADLVSFRPFK